MSASLRGFDFAAYMRAFNVTLQEQADLIIINENKKFDSKEDRKAWVDSWVAKADHNSHEVADGFARYVTFQDDTYLATIATTMKRILNLDRTLFSKLSPKRFGQRRSDPDYIDTTIPFGEFVLRYPKVPANLLNRGLAYSPAGFAKAAYDLYTAQKLIRDGKVEGSAKYRQGVESLSRALLGTGLTAFTAKLSSLNIMSGGDEEEKVRANQLRADVTGEKQNQINIDALRRYIISGFDDRAAKRRRGDVLIDYAWAQPLAFSASFGVNYQEAQEVESLKDQTETMTGALGEETEETIRGMIKGVTGASEILTEQPMLSGLKDLFRSYGQETNYLENIVRILEGIPSSMVPQMIGQLRQFNDNTKRQAWAGRNPAQRAVNRLMNRLPFLSERLPAAYKVLGQNVPREIYANGNNTWYNVWFNPAWVSEYNPDPLAIELLKNYEETLSVGTLPRKQTTTIEPGDGKKYQLTNEDISQLQRIMAGYVTRFASREIRDPDYRTLEPEEQVKNLSGHVNDSAQMARDWFLVNRVNKYLSSKSKRDRKYMEKLKELQEEAQDRLTENRN
jgi:hypothetical protein